MPATGTSARRRRPWLAIVGVVCLLLVVGVIAFVLINPSAIATVIKNRMLPQVSERLGREVQAGDIHVQLFPHFGATIQNVSVAGEEGEPPLLSASEAGVSLKLWPLIRSRGKEVDVTSVDLRDVALNLVRRPDGHWNYEDLGGQPSAPKPAPTPGSSKSEVTISEVSLSNASVHVIDEAAKRAGNEAAATVALSQLNVTAHDVGPGQPTTVDVSGALASDVRNLQGHVRIDPLPASAAALKEGGWPQVTGNFSLNALALQQLQGFLPGQMGAYFNGGRLSTSLNIATPQSGKYVVSGDTKLDQMLVRGSPANGGFHLVATVEPERTNGLAAQVTDLHLQGPGIDLAGTASYTAPERVRFALNGQKLDLDTLLGALPPRQPKEASAGQPLVPPSMRKTVQKADVSGTLALKEITSGKLRAHDLNVNAKLNNGTLTVTTGQVGLYSGRAVLDGTKVNLLAAKPEWDLHAKLDAVNLGDALSELTGSNVLSGLASGALSVQGAGNDWNQLRTNLTGNGQVAVANGSLNSADLGTQIAQPLTNSLQQLGLSNAVPKPPTGKTELKDLTAKFSVSDGWLDLKQPLSVNTPVGTFALGGRIGLDQQLALDGHLALSQQFLSTVATGQFQPKGSIDVPLKIGGTLKSPTIEGVDWGAVARNAIVSQGLQGKSQDLQKQLQNQAQQQLKGFLHGL